MKPYTTYYTLILLIFFSTACAPTVKLPTRIERIESLNVLDFREYTKKGFLFTPEGYTGKYESIGMIDFWVEEGAIWKIKEKKIGRYAGSDLVERSGSWEYEGTDLQSVLDVIFNQCNDMGANALINFKITRSIEEKGRPERRAFITIYRVQGLAIIRA